MATSKWPAILLLLVGTGCSETFSHADDDALREQLANHPPEFVIFKELKNESGDDRIRSLLKQQQNALSIALESRFKEWVAGRGTLPFLNRDTEALCKVRLELCKNDKERIAILKQLVEWTNAIEALTRIRLQQEKCATQDWKETQYVMFDAQIKLLRMERQAAKP
jgi:hypothetical protein